MKATKLQRKAQLRRQKWLKGRTRIRAIAVRRAGTSHNVIKSLDAIASALCKLKAGGFRVEDSNQWIGPCAKCGNRGTLQWSHFIGRRCHRTRWEADNAEALCGGCHMAFDQNTSAIPYEDWKRFKLSHDRIEALRDRLNAKFRVDTELLLVALKAEWKKLTGDDWR